MTFSIVALLIDWRIAIVGGLAGLIIALLMSKLIRVLKQSGYKQTDRVSSLTVDMVDMLNNIKALKSMDRYGPMVQGLSGLLKRIKRSLITIHLAKNGVIQGSDALQNLMTGAFIYAAYVLFGTKLARVAGDRHCVFPDREQPHQTSKADADGGRRRKFLCAHDGTY